MSSQNILNLAVIPFIKHLFTTAALVPLVCFAQGTLHVTFDGMPPLPPATSIGVQQYFESGIWFRPLGVVGQENTISHRRGGGGVPLVPDNGTPYLAAHLGSSLLFSFQDGGLFGINSVDLAGYSTVVPDFSVPFFGYRFDGSIVSTNFSGTGIEFRTVYFGAEWSSGLTRVEIPTYSWSLDNLTVEIPEPTSSVLILIGAVIFGLSRMKGRGA
jgi:hypothetical protein